MVRDQLEIDSSRLKAGGVCLSCKSPFSPTLQKEMGIDYYKKPFMETLSRIPEKFRTLELPASTATIQGHESQDFARLQPGRGF